MGQGPDRQRSPLTRQPMRYGPARLSSSFPFQLSCTCPSLNSSSTAAWTFGMATLQSGAAAPALTVATIVRATSLGQTVDPDERAARSANVASRASKGAITLHHLGAKLLVSRSCLHQQAQHDRVEPVALPSFTLRSLPRPSGMPVRVLFQAEISALGATIAAPPGKCRLVQVRLPTARRQARQELQLGQKPGGHEIAVALGPLQVGYSPRPHPDRNYVVARQSLSARLE